MFAEILLLGDWTSVNIMPISIFFNSNFLRKKYPMYEQTFLSEPHVASAFSAFQSTFLKDP
jgi:hypothetical protein